MENKSLNDENTIIELSSVTEDTLYDEEISNPVVEVKEDEIKIKKSNNKKKKTKKEFFWNKLNKKTKIIILVFAVVSVAIICFLVLYLLVFNEDEKPVDTLPSVIIEKDNYIYDNGVLKLLDSKEEVIGQYECIDKDANKCYVASLSNEDTFDVPKYLDKDKNPLEQKTKIYLENYTFIYDEGKIVLYDIKNNNKNGEYLLVKTGINSSNIIVLKNAEEKYGAIELTQDAVKTVLEFKYDYIGMAYSEDTFVVKENNKTFLINKLGKTLTNSIKGEVKNFDSKYIASYQDGYILYDYKGAKVLDDVYDYIDFKDGYIFVIDSKKVFVYDSDLNKLNENAIRVKNDNYQVTYIFDEDKNLKDTKRSYTITITPGSISFTLDDESVKSINLYENVINKNHDYVSYQDGVLYFYEDEEKTQLLGKYSCVNKNTVKSDSDEYLNCFIAKDTSLVNKNNNLGYVPIINNNYVFINDTKTGASKNNIILYDLKNNTQKVKYQAIDTGLGNDQINFIDSINSLIFARNMDGNLGVITFTSDGPQGVIPFKSDNEEGTKNISYLDNYLLVTRADKNYLYTKAGVLLASSKFAIKDYRDGYLVVKDKGYLIYQMANSETGTIISDELDYVELFDEFFVGVKNNKLNVYAYTDGKNKLIAEDLEIINNKINNGYQMAIHSDCYVIKIYQSENATIDYKYNLEDWSKVE